MPPDTLLDRTCIGGRFLSKRPHSHHLLPHLPLKNMYTIAPADPADAEVIHEIKMRAFAEEGRLSENMEIPPLMEAVSAIELDIRTHTVLTARDTDGIIGSARGIAIGPVCTIRAVCVEPSHHGRGIGDALLRAIEEAHPGVERFELTTNTLVPGNVAFYERRGYQVTELTKFTGKIVLAQMRKYVSAKDAGTFDSLAALIPVLPA